MPGWIPNMPHAHSGTRQPSYIFSNYLKLALLSPCKSNGSSYQILLCRCSHCGNRHVLPCIINASQGQHVRELTLLAHFAWSTVWQKKPAGTKCVRGGSSSSVGLTAPTSGLARRATSLNKYISDNNNGNSGDCF